MRDIEDYCEKWRQKSFEDIQVAIRIKKVVEIIQQYEHHSILEIGCGFEPFFKYFDDYQQMTVVDPCNEFINNAKELSAGNQRVRCIQGFLEDQIALLNRGGQRFDFVILTSLLHEVENPSDFLIKLKSVCNPHTVVHVNVPNAYSFHRLLAKEMGLIQEVFDKSDRQIMLQQQTMFSMESLSELLRQTGFKTLEQGTYFVKPFTHDQLYRMLSSGIIDERVLDGLFQMDKYMPEYGSEIYINCKLE